MWLNVHISAHAQFGDEGMGGYAGPAKSSHSLPLCLAPDSICGGVQGCWVELPVQVLKEGGLAMLICITKPTEYGIMLTPVS